MILSSVAEQERKEFGESAHALAHGVRRPWQHLHLLYSFSQGMAGLNDISGRMSEKL